MKVVFILASTRHGPMIFSRLDYRMLAPNRGIGLGYQLLEKGGFEPREVATVKQVLQLRRKQQVTALWRLIAARTLARILSNGPSAWKDGAR